MFYDILEGRKDSLDYKLLVIFLDFYFRENRPEKCVLRYPKRKKRLSRVYKQEVAKVEKLGFFPRG